jgi:hypothetical protein
MIDHSDVESLVESCFVEMQSASRAKYDVDHADRTAALFLTAQMKLSFLIEEVEMKARNAKNEIERVEGEKYFEYKVANSDKKITENMITSYVAKESEVVRVKTECAQLEATLKKWNYVLNVLNNGHVFFRNIAKNKTWSE